MQLVAASPAQTVVYAYKKLQLCRLKQNEEVFPIHSSRNRASLVTKECVIFKTHEGDLILAYRHFIIFVVEKILQQTLQIKFFVDAQIFVV